MTSGQANNRRTATIASKLRAPSTPQWQVRVHRVHSGVSSRRAVTLASRRNSQRSRLFVRAEPSPHFVSPTQERKAILRFDSSGWAASAARYLPAYRVFMPSDSILSLLDAPPFGLSRRDGRPDLEHGS